MRYIAKEVNGKGYIFDKDFSANSPIAVEETIIKAQKQVKKFNAEEEKTSNKGVENGNN